MGAEHLICGTTSFVEHVASRNTALNQQHVPKHFICKHTNGESPHVFLEKRRDWKAMVREEL
jgi:hypothetical protein